MAGNKAAIKSRIKSVNATKKITGAMELIATVKLQKNRNVMLENRTYTNAIKETVAQMLDGDTTIDNEYLKENDAPLKLYFVFASDMGLCGGYNINLLKEFTKAVDKKDIVYYFGEKNYQILKEEGYNIQNEMVGSDSIDYLYIEKFARSAIQMYKEGKINSINIVYTEFINNVSFRPVIDRVLPCVVEKSDKPHREVLYEPSSEAILDDLIPMLCMSEIYARYLEAKTSEHGSRRFAMQNATDNANELTDELLLAYNQARQAAITSEITEIVAGADAL